MTTTFSVRECLSFGWKTFRVRPWFFVGTTALVGVLQLAVNGIQNALPAIVGIVAALIASTLLYTGIIHFYLKAHDDATKVSYKDLWHPTPFLSYLGLSILLLVIVGVGLMLLIIPGIFFMLMFFVSGYVVVEKKVNPIEALKESARLTKGHRLKLLLLMLTMIGLSILGAIPLFLGLLVVAPVIAIASAHAYRHLQGK